MWTAWLQIWLRNIARISVMASNLSPFHEDRCWLHSRKRVSGGSKNQDHLKGLDGDRMPFGTAVLEPRTVKIAAVFKAVCLPPYPSGFENSRKFRVTHCNKTFSKLREIPRLCRQKSRRKKCIWWKIAKSKHLRKLNNTIEYGRRKDASDITYAYYVLEEQRIDTN